MTTLALERDRAKRPPGRFPGWRFGDDPAVPFCLPHIPPSLSPRVLFGFERGSSSLSGMQGRPRAPFGVHGHEGARPCRVPTRRGGRCHHA